MKWVGRSLSRFVHTMISTLFLASATLDRARPSITAEESVRCKHEMKNRQHWDSVNSKVHLCILEVVEYSGFFQNVMNMGN